MEVRQSAKACTVVLHDDSVSKHDVLCDPNLLQPGAIAYLKAARTKVLCIQAQAEAKKADEVSVHVAVAREFGFENRMKAQIEPIDDIKDATATHVELLFRDQHLSRADMWRIKGQVESSVLYQGQKVKYLGSTTATVEAVYIAGQEVDSAYVSNPQTKLIFRSGSARFTILIQVSKEMLEYWYDDDLMYERLIDGFLPDLFHRWDRLRVRHTLTVVLFGRRQPTVLPESNGDVKSDNQHSKPNDFFRVVAANVPSGEWRRVIRKLKTAFNSVTRSQQVSLAASGNMLEAINFAAMDFANSNIDPPLSSTGTSITAITAGSGLFAADDELLRRTTTTLMGNSVGVDIVSLSPKPLHPVPLFQYERDKRWEYALPHWADVSYWHTTVDSYSSTWLLPPTSGDVCDIAIASWRADSFDNAGPSLLQSLDAFDEGVFANVSGDADHDYELRLGSSHNRTDSNESRTDSTASIPDIESPSQDQTEPDTAANSLQSAGSDSFKSEPVESPPPRPKRDAARPHPLLQVGRKISLGPRGLALSQGVASITVSAHNVQHDRESSLSVSPFASIDTSSVLARQIRDTLRKKPSQRSLTPQQPPSSSLISEPINIRNEEQKIDELPIDRASLIEKAVLDQSVETGRDSHSSLTATPKPGSHDIPARSTDRLGDQKDAMSPWLTLLNPCNPRRDNMTVASQYRQWQNIFPRAVSSSAFKWDSICTPAILPLMTENRVSVLGLERYFNKKVRRLLATDSNAHQALVQMVAIRLISGFQIVPIRTLQRAQLPTEKIERMLLSIGDCYHELRCLSSIELQVSEYERSETITPRNPSTLYYPTSIKSFAARNERPQTIEVYEDGSFTDWSSLDDQSVNSTLAENVGQTQARFALIPVDFVRSESNQRVQAKELSDEERRLDGIQRLTQLWQRNLYFADEDERHKSSLAKPKTSNTFDRDPNPLAIEYQTRDPSSVVSAYGGNLNGHLTNGGATIPLFAESEKYHSSNFDMVKLVKQIQDPPPVGIELRDRRWFTRLHLKCFRGDEMTNWLLGVFKDLQTREDAVVLGNQLMSKDIFTHVRGKHEFRDGNYFYQIRSAHRVVDYPDTAGLFTKGIGRSVPTTPVTDFKQSPMTRPIQGDSDSSSRGTPTPTLAPVDSGKREVMLSQMLQYNVDSTRKSSQVEVVNLHYDRIHNPDNCYHIQLDWTDTTTKLILESLTRWRSLVENYGLKLVQLPMAEANRVCEQHPFDQAIPVRLAVRPPDRILATPQLDPHTFSPRLAEDTNGYHKALLRKMDFVLDFEAASSFPRRVDVRYSWGRPTYELTQFIHKSGLLLAQISNDGQSDFLLLQNRVATQTTSPFVPKKADFTASEKFVQNFLSFCRNQTLLGAFFDEVKKPKQSIPSPVTTAALLADNDVPHIELPPHLTHKS